jgi:hypothetical protein
MNALPAVTGLRRKVAALTSVTVAVLALGAAQAGAVVVESGPVWPIPTDAPLAPPPVPALPAAAATAPPASEIADPITPRAVCGDWYLQGDYGDRWPGGSPWWEYRCSYEDTFYSNPCTSGACNAFCWDCYWQTQDWTDYFYWDGSDAVFYGEAYSYSLVSEGYLFPPYSSTAWWDGPTTQWYSLGPSALTVSKQGAGSGDVSSSPAGISCGYSCDASFDAGTVVTLTASPDAASLFTGWSGDCSGSGSCEVTLDRARSVTATFALKTFTLTVSKSGTGSGAVTSTPAGIDCGDSCQASFSAGGAVTLTTAPDAFSLFTGWAGDCTGSDSCQLTMDRARSVTATFARNEAPRARFTVACTGLNCTLDGSASTDDGPIRYYRWDFGDGATGGGMTIEHNYRYTATYTVKLTVTDDVGATNTTQQTIALISLNARPYKLYGRQKVALSWTGSSIAFYDVFRDGAKIATVQARQYTDNLGYTRSGSYRYKVCETSSSICSNEATVSF